MSAIADTAQVVMDLYYQSYKSSEDFFELEHFVYLCGVGYAKLLEDEYKEARERGMAEEGYTDIIFQADWLVEEIIAMKRDPENRELYVGDLPKPVMSFPFDINSSGIQDVRPTGKTRCRDFVRTSVRELYMDCMLPKTSVSFFYQTGGKLFIQNSVCALGDVKVRMIPDISVDPESVVPKTKEDAIIRQTLALMKAARDGVVVDMSNNSNPNKTMETELDGKFLKLRNG